MYETRPLTTGGALNVFTTKTWTDDEKYHDLTVLTAQMVPSHPKEVLDINLKDADGTKWSLRFTTYTFEQVFTRLLKECGFTLAEAHKIKLRLERQPGTHVAKLVWMRK